MTKPKLILVSVKDPTLRYDVLSYNAETKTAVCKGRFGEFDVKPFTKEKITRDGYTLEREKEHA